MIPLNVKVYTLTLLIMILGTDYWGTDKDVLLFLSSRVAGSVEPSSHLEVNHSGAGFPIPSTTLDTLALLMMHHTDYWGNDKAVLLLLSSRAAGYTESSSHLKVYCVDIGLTRSPKILDTPTLPIVILDTDCCGFDEMILLSHWAGTGGESSRLKVYSVDTGLTRPLKILDTPTLPMMMDCCGYDEVILLSHLAGTAAE